MNKLLDQWLGQDNYEVWCIKNSNSNDFNSWASSFDLSFQYWESYNVSLHDLKHTCNVLSHHIPMIDASKYRIDITNCLEQTTKPYVLLFQEGFTPRNSSCLMNFIKECQSYSQEYEWDCIIFGDDDSSPRELICNEYPFIYRSLGTKCMHAMLMTRSFIETFLIRLSLPEHFTRPIEDISNEMIIHYRKTLIPKKTFFFQTYQPQPSLYHKQIVVATYRTTYDTVEQPPGLGDFLFGCMSLHQFSLLFDYDFYIDFSHHPLSNCIESKLPITLQALNYNVVELFNDKRDELLEFMSCNTLPIVYITCHTFPKLPIHQSTRQFIQSYLEPQQTTQDKFNSLLKQCNLSPKGYMTIHLRCGDDYSNKSFIIENRIFEFLDTLFPHRCNPKKCIVLSDSSLVKQTIANRYGAIYTDYNPIHLGSIKSFDDNIKQDTNEMVEQSYLEFLLLANSSCIFAYTRYSNGLPQASGFTKTCSDIFDIPLIYI